jgi:hypothetical protein
VSYHSLNLSQSLEATFLGGEVELEIQLGMRKPAGKNTMKATHHAVWHALQTELVTGSARTTEGRNKK